MTDEEEADNESDFGAEVDSGVELNDSGKGKGKAGAAISTTTAATKGKGKAKVIRKTTTTTTTTTKVKVAAKPRAKANAKKSVPVKKEAGTEIEDDEEVNGDKNGDITGVKESMNGGEADEDGDMEEAPASKRVKMFPNLKDNNKANTKTTAASAVNTTKPTATATAVLEATNAKANPPPSSNSAAIVIDEDDKDAKATTNTTAGNGTGTNLKWVSEKKTGNDSRPAKTLIGEALPFDTDAGAPPATTATETGAKAGEVKPKVEDADVKSEIDAETQRTIDMVRADFPKHSGGAIIPYDL